MPTRKEPVRAQLRRRRCPAGSTSSVASRSSPSTRQSERARIRKSGSVRPFDRGGDPLHHLLDRHQLALAPAAVLGVSSCPRCGSPRCRRARRRRRRGGPLSAVSPPWSASTMVGTRTPRAIRPPNSKRAPRDRRGPSPRSPGTSPRSGCRPRRRRESRSSPPGARHRRSSPPQRPSPPETPAAFGASPSSTRGLVSSCAERAARFACRGGDPAGRHRRSRDELSSCRLVHARPPLLGCIPPSGGSAVNRRPRHRPRRSTIMSATSEAKP